MAVTRSHAVTAAVPAAAALVALLAGCGGGNTELASAGLPGDGPTGTATTAPAVVEPPPTGSRSAADLLRAARAAFAAAPSVHVTGTAVRGSDAYVVDLRLKGAAGGTATIRTSGQTVNVVRIGDIAYVGGDLAFWRGVTGDDAQARAMVGSYVKVPARQGNFGQFTVFTQPDVVTAVLPDPAAPATVGPRTTIGGRAAIPVRAGDGSTLSVAATGPAYPLRLDGLASGQVVFLDFSDYGADVPLVAPPVKSVVTGGPGQGS
jgi:hypothetical protein